MLSTRIATRLLPLALALSFTAAAQDPRSAADGPWVSISLAGPGTLRQRLLPTNLGTLLSGPRTKVLRKLLVGYLRDRLRESDAEDHRRLLADVLKHLLGFRGHVDAEIHGRGRGGSEFGVHVLLSPDSAAGDDGNALSRVLRQLLAATGEAPRTLTFADGGTCQVYGRGSGFAGPMRYRGTHLALFFGTDIDATLANGRRRLDAARAERLARAKRAKRPADLLAVKLDLRQLRALMLETTHDDQKLLLRQLLGLDTWQTLALTAGTLGPRLRIALTATCTPGDRGVFEALLPAVDHVPMTLALAPPTTQLRPPGFVSGHLRADRLFANYLTLLSNLRFFGKPKTVAELREKVRNELGFDLEKDFLAHLDTDLIGLVEPPTQPAQQPAQPRTDDPAPPPLSGACIALRVKDDAKFAATFKKLLQSPATRSGEPFQRGDIEVTPVRMFFRGEHLAHVPGYLVYAIGEPGLRSLVALDARRRAATPGPPPLRRIRRYAPPGFNLGATVPLRIATEPFGSSLVWQLWCETRTSFVPPALRPGWTRADLDQQVKKFLPMLERHGLSRIDVLGGFAQTPRTSVSRVLLIW